MFGKKKKKLAEQQQKREAIIAVTTLTLSAFALGFKAAGLIFQKMVKKAIKEVDEEKAAKTAKADKAKELEAEAKVEQPSFDPDSKVEKA